MTTTAADLHRLGLALAAALLALLVLAPAPAGAHAVLIASSPADEAIVTDELTEVILSFNEPVEMPQVVVADPAGEDVTDGAARAEGEQVLVDIGDVAASGDYTIAYRAVSDDGHPISGELVFTYEGPLAEDDEEAVLEDPTSPPGTVVDEDEAPSTEEADPASPEPVAAEETAVQGDDGSSFPVLLGIGIALIAALAGAAFAALRRSPAE